LAPLPAQARANSNQPSSTDARADAERRVEFIAVTQSDELLEQIGQALDGESAIRHAETIAAAAELIQASQPCVVMLDAREHANPGNAVEQLQPANGLSVVVVFAPADQTNTVAQASMKLGEAMYKQQAEADAKRDAAKDDVVDAEFTEVDDDKNNKKSA